MRNHIAYDIVYETLPDVSSQQQAHKFLMKYRNKYLPTMRFKDALHKITEDRNRFQSFCRSVYQSQNRIHAYSFREIEQSISCMTEKQVSRLLDYVLIEKTVRLLQKEQKGGRK